MARDKRIGKIIGWALVSPFLLAFAPFICADIVGRYICNCTLRMIDRLAHAAKARNIISGEWITKTAERLKFLFQPRREARHQTFLNRYMHGHAFARKVAELVGGPQHAFRMICDAPPLSPKEITDPQYYVSLRQAEIEMLSRSAGT